MCYYTYIEPFWANQSLWGCGLMRSKRKGGKDRHGLGSCGMIWDLKVGQDKLTDQWTSGHTNTLLFVYWIFAAHCTPILQHVAALHILHGSLEYFGIPWSWYVMVLVFQAWFYSTLHTSTAICVPDPDVSRMVSQLDEALYSKSTPQTCREFTKNCGKLQLRSATTMSSAKNGAWSSIYGHIL